MLPKGRGSTSSSVRMRTAPFSRVGRGGRQQRRGASSLTIAQAHEDLLLLVLTFLVVAEDLRRASPDVLVSAVLLLCARLSHGVSNARRLVVAVRPHL